MRHIGIVTLLLVLCAVPQAHAQTPAVATLHITLSEKQFFEFGYQLAGAAFAYADLAKQSNQIFATHNKASQIVQLGKLAPLALRDRGRARDGFVSALDLMRNLNAPPKAVVPVAAAAALLNRPLAVTHDARALAAVNPDAGRTLSTLSEFEKLSSLPENAAIQKWLARPGADAGQVWYAEGLITALVEIAAAQQMPDLLPPAGELAGDLRGLRDWLASRLPDQPTPDQTALEQSLDDFLRQTASGSAKKLLTSAQLQALADISRKLQAEVLGIATLPELPPSITAPPPATPPASPPSGVVSP